MDFKTSFRCKAVHNRAEYVQGKIQIQHMFIEKALLLTAQLGENGDCCKIEEMGQHILSLIH